MKTKTTLAVLSALISLPAFSAIVIDVNNSSFELSGTTATREGSLPAFPVPGGQTRYSSVVTSGTDKIATIADTPSNTDFYLNYGSANLSNGGVLTTTNARYVEVHYSLSEAFVGSSHQLRLDTSDQAAAFDDFTNSASIDSSAGSHTFIIDLLSDDGTTLSNDWSGTWTVFRWDFWNNAGNNNKAFTIDKIVYSDAITVIPEPSSLALLGLGGLLIARRRR